MCVRVPSYYTRNIAYAGNRNHTRSTYKSTQWAVAVTIIMRIFMYKYNVCVSVFVYIYYIYCNIDKLWHPCSSLTLCAIVT